LTHILASYTSDHAIIQIELNMPDTLSNIVTSRYTAVKERRSTKKLSILAKQMPFHGFDLNAGTLPDWVKKDIAKDFGKQLKRYNKAHSI